MARKRSIDPDLWTDGKIQALKDVRAYVMYIGAISQADDYGRLEWSARQLQAKIFPGRRDVKFNDCERWMAALVEVGLLKLYEVAGRIYAWHPNWSVHQYVNRPTKSRIPAHFEDQFSESSVNTHGVLTEDSVSPHGALSEVYVPSESESESVSVSSLRSERVAKATPALRAKKRVPSAEDLAAYEILNAAFPVIAKHHGDLGMSPKTWQARNKAAALDLFRAGKKAADVVRALKFAFADPEARKFYGGITTLLKLQEHWPKLSAIAKRNGKAAGSYSVRPRTDAEVAEIERMP